ncbi:MAG TPA: hypothetical protein VG322_10195 [Candidatus Acidoferrales bacterium]|nr:hypothetical protein [Candidatus Acidoferrales bacterium]
MPTPHSGKWLALLALLFVTLAPPARPADAPTTIPVSDIKPGMKGEVYTIFEGDQVEKIDLVVIGILNDALGPKQDVILVQLLGDKADKTGVAAGMSGSPVYFDGKLAGALSLKIGNFTKDAIGGVTPIASMYDVAKSSDVPAMPVRSTAENFGNGEMSGAAAAMPVSVGTGQFLTPIETPLISAGLYPETLSLFKNQMASWGIAAMAGGKSPALPSDPQLKPGDMIGMDLVRGDLSLSAGCTVTSVQGDRIYACGHPLFGFGAVEIPISRAHVVMTLASSQASTKVISTGGTIGTLTQDRQTAVMGKLGPAPAMIPMDLTLTTPQTEKKFHFDVAKNPQLTPLLVALASFNGIVSTPAYAEGSTIQLDGNIDMKGHSTAHIEDLFAPTDAPIPTGFFAATAVQGIFSRIFSNPYEIPQIDHIDLHVKLLNERRWAMIDSAWLEKSEVQPGETVAVKVLLRPYRGAPFIQEIPVVIPAQASRGALQVVVSDADYLNRNVQSLASSSQGQLPGLEELIKLVNRERRNDRLYASLLQATPTMLVEDKEMPNLPASELSVLNQRQNPGGARLLRESTAGEWSVDMHQVIAGQHMLTITVK